jgi:hypothetical protein
MQDPKNAVEYTPVIYARHASRLVWQERFDGGPFTIGEFVAHDSGLRFGSLNHALGGTIKPLRLVEADTNPGLTSAFGGTADMGDLLLGLSRSKMTQTDWVNSIAAPNLGASTNGTNTFGLMDAPC